MEVKSLEIIQRGLRLYLLLAAILGKRVSVTRVLSLGKHESFWFDRVRESRGVFTEARRGQW